MSVDRAAYQRQIANDAAALLDILPGLERLEAAMEQARQSMSPGRRRTQPLARHSC